MPETVNGFVERVTYHNSENGFAVLKVKVKARQDLVTVVGSTTSVSAGEHLEAIGRWVVDRDHGQQFKAEELKTTHPASADGIERYLASGAIRSIGPKLAAKIVRIYKERTHPCWWEPLASCRHRTENVDRSPSKQRSRKSHVRRTANRSIRRF